MKYRKLRIAWSVAWAGVAVLLCVMWVRSYYLNDVLFNVDKNLVETSLGSNAGSVYLVRSNQFRGNPNGIRTNYSSGGYSIATLQQTFGWKHLSVASAKPESVFEWKTNVTTTMIQIPMWLLAVPLAVAGTMPWLPNRFSLRTLLIATTLVAVGMGLIVWAARS